MKFFRANGRELFEYVRKYYADAGKSITALGKNSEFFFVIPALELGVLTELDTRFRSCYILGGDYPTTPLFQHRGERAMAYTYEQLSDMTVAELRKIADGIEHEAVKGHSTMHKEKLIPALCEALGIEAHAHHRVVGNFDKGKVKQQIRRLKVERETALKSHDRTKLREVRQQIHKLKRELRKHIV